jgi:hypothetical protein
MNNQKWLVLFFVVLCFGMWGLEAKDIVIYENSLNKTIHCDGDEVNVYGNQNVLNIKGECSKLNVQGNKNTITVEAVASISTPGSWNKVTWERGIDGDKPSISNFGKSNEIKKAPDKEEAVEEEGEVPSALDTALSKLDALKKGKTSFGEGDSQSEIIRIEGNSQVKTMTLKGEKLVVNGNLHQIEVKGYCGFLQVNGNKNTIHVDAVGTINTVGNMNKVFWKTGSDDEDPTIYNVGTGNKIVHVEE